MDPELSKQTIEVACRYLDKVVDAPMSELAGILSDKIGFWRFKNKVRTLLKAKEFLEEKGIDPRKALPGTVIPLLEASGDVDDEPLSEMFAGLLAKHLDADSSDDVHPSYSKVLSQLAPLDAALLAGFARGILDQGRDYRKTALKLESAAQQVKKPVEMVRRAFENIWRLGICSRGDGLAHLNQVDQIVFSDFGWAFIRGCLFSKIGSPGS